MNGKREALILAFILCFFAGMMVEHGIRTPAPMKEQIPAPAVRLKTGALVAERTPQQAPASVVPEIPKDATVARVITVDIQPPEQLKGPIRLHLAEVNTPEGSRIVADAPGAVVVDAKDYTGGMKPREALSSWSAGLGAAVTRDGPQPLAAVAWTHGSWTIGSTAGIRSGPNWPGVTIWAVFRF